MTIQLDSPVTRLLDSLKIAYQIIEIPLSPDQKPIRSLEQLLAEQSLDPNQIVRSLLFRTGSDNFVLLAAAGGGRADWGTLRKQLDERRLTMAQAEEVLEATGFPIGAVPPIALPESVRILVEENVFDHEQVVIGSGVLGFAISLTCVDLQKALPEADRGKFIKQ